MFSWAPINNEYLLPGKTVKSGILKENAEEKQACFFVLAPGIFL
jgi:hypothetical protein